MQFDAAFNNYNALLQIPKGYGKDLVNLRNKGIPNIFSNEILLPPGIDAVTGANIPAPDAILSEEEYIAKYVNWAQDRNIHTKRVADGTTTSFSSPTTGIGGTSINYKTVFSPEKAEKKAKEYYENQVKHINATLNGAIDIHRNDKGDENFVSPFKRFSFVEGSIGTGLDQMTGASVNMVSGQKNQFNPQVKAGDEAYYDFQTLVNEINLGTNIISIEKVVLNKDNMSGEINQMSKNYHSFIIKSYTMVKCTKRH